MLGRLRPLVASLAVAALIPLTAGTASADDAAAAGRVIKDEVTLTVGARGVTHARETVLYDFSGTKDLKRVFVTRTHDSITRDRVYKVENIKASSPDGGPTKVSTSTSGTRTTVKVAADAKLTGRRTVVLEYDVSGIVSPLGSTEELRWTALGGWQVPMDEARVVVDGGAMIRNINCFAGPLEASTGCTQFFIDHSKTRAEYRQSQMFPDEWVTVVVGFPAGTTKDKPVYERRHTVATAFSVNGVTASALGALLLLLLGGVAALYLLRGRDARVVAQKAAEGDHAPVSSSGFEPPDGVRPGQIGTLIDEQADVIDVTATIVDLAVRGYLLVDEEDRETGRLDWELQRLERPNDDLLPYERLLLDSLFTAPDGTPRTAVKLSALGGTFATQLAKVRSAMYDDVVAQGWFARRPDTVRSRWTIAGFVLTGLGIVGTVALALFTDLALVGLAVIIAGAALAYGGQYMPAKTARGATVLAHTIGFRAFLERGEITQDGLGPQQRIALFSRFLPYAVVFDLVPKWAKTVENAGEKAKGADNLYWYEGPAEWDLSKFAESMRAFTLTTSGSISQSRGL